MKSNSEHNPMRAIEKAPMPTCGAHTRAGGICRQPAMKNGRCYYHGGKSKSGPEHGRYKHGGYTMETKALHRELREEARSIARHFREISELIGNS